MRLFDCAVVTYVCTEKHLVTLRKQQREKIEEIKKKTNYNTTRNLIERYDYAVDSPLRRRIPGGSQPVTPQNKVPAPQPQRLALTPGQVPPALQQQLSRGFTAYCIRAELWLIILFISSHNPTTHVSTAQAMV